MDTELLVEDRINNGQTLLDELTRNGFDVTVAFWARPAQKESWYFYIGLSSTDPDKIGEAYGRVYAYLDRIPNFGTDLSRIKVLPSSDPRCLAAKALRDRYPGMMPIRIRGIQLANLAVEEIYIYPRIDMSKPVVLSVVRDVMVDHQAKKITVYKKKITLPPGTIVGKAYSVEYTPEYPEGKLSERSVDDAIHNLPEGWTYTVVEEN